MLLIAQVATFFSLPEYHAWSRALPEAERRHWRAKYYKGLGTSSAAEAREYFGRLPEHRVQLAWSGAADDDVIDMAFSKRRAADRREWMLRASLRAHEAEQSEAEQSEAEVGTALPHAPPSSEEVTDAVAAALVAPPSGRRLAPRRTYKEFVNDELVQFSLADLRRSVPSAIDGLKPSQRKVLFACFSKKLLPSAAEMKVVASDGS